jgi:cell division protein FtsB
MAPASGSASAAARRGSAAPDWRRGSAAPDPRPASRKPPLRVLSPAPRSKPRRGNRVLLLVSALLVVGSLMAVVVADDVVAQGQVQLSAVQQQVDSLTNTHRELQTGVSVQRAPQMVVNLAENQLGMVSPGQITDLPQVSLSSPLPVPQTAPIPAPPPPSTPTSSTPSTAPN